MAKKKKSAGKKHRNRSPWAYACIDIIAIGVCLLIFALFHHVLPREIAINEYSTGRDIMQNLPVNTVKSPTATPRPSPIPDATPSPEIPQTPSPSPEITAEPEALPDETEVPVQPDPVGYFGTKFANKFTDGMILNGDGFYQSSNLSISTAKHSMNGATFYVADIYIRDISCIKAGFANDKFGRNLAQWPEAIAYRHGAVLAINGDYYGAHESGIVIRNGTLYRDKNDPSRDLCILYWDGTIETLPCGSFDAHAAMEAGAYQVWSFGPRLLDDSGQPVSAFDSEISGANPRTALGYYEPGHYCFVVVDGRSKKSNGITLASLSQLMYNLGCTRAYNLDGGKTSRLVANGKVINHPSDYGRKCSDVVMILDQIDTEV